MAVTYPGLLQAETKFYSYQIPFSMWLDGSADQFTRTFGSGDRDTWTFSCWLKRTGLASGGSQVLFNGGTSGNNLTRLELTSADKLRYVHLDGGVVTDELVTTAVFRDVCGWYHIMLAVDTTNDTEANRVRLYVNGSEITALDTANYPGASVDTDINDAAQHRIGTNQAGSGEFLKGYLADVVFVDGQQLTPSDFGEFKNGIWVPKSYGGSYGTNGFHLDFAASGDLGNDVSGNANDWTATSISSANQSADTPTNNCPVMNAIDPAYSSGLPTFSGDGLTVGYSTTAYRGCRATVAIPATGKWAFQVTINGTASASVEPTFGIMSIPDQGGGNPHQNSNDHVFVYPGAGHIYKNGSSVQTGLGTPAAASVMEVLVDMDAGTVDFKDDGVAYGSQVTGLTAGVEYWPFASVYNSSAGLTFDFGQNGYTPSDSSYLTLLPANMAEPLADSWPYVKVMETTLYTGDGSSRTISGLEHEPGIAWFKSRSAAQSHRLVDALRGTTAAMYPDTTNAEATESGLTAFNSDGFDLGAATSGYNTNSATYAVWTWALGTAFSGTTTGAGTSKSYSGQYNIANGMAVITYEGNGTGGHTIPLPSAMTALYGAPKMIIVKDRDAASSWRVYHVGISSAAQVVYLDTSNAATTDADQFNSTAPSSSVVTLGSGGTNVNTNDYVMLVFWEVPGFSKALTYVGNAAAEGVFVNCGFRPGWVLLKNSGSAQGWHIFDNKRLGYNVDNNQLYPDAASVEQTTDVLDMVSNGIKLRTANANWNANTMIGWAFAEQPGKYANAR